MKKTPVIINKKKQNIYFSLLMSALILTLVGYVVFKLFISASGTTEPYDYSGYYLFTDEPDARDKEILKNDLVKGISMANIKWSQHQPSYGEYDWDKVDSFFKAADDAGGKPVLVRLLIGSCGEVPAWLFTPHGGMPAVQKSPAFTNRKCGEGAYIPLFWDPTFQRDWQQFINALGAHVGNRKVIVMVTGPWKIYGEPFMPVCIKGDSALNNNKREWTEAYRKFKGRGDLSFTDLENEFDAFQNRLIDSFGDAFKGGQPVAMAAGQLMGECDGYKSEKDSHGKFINNHPRLGRQMVAARTKYGSYSNGTHNRGFFAQYNGLNESDLGPVGLTGWIGDFLNPVDGQLNKGIIGYQMIGATEPFCGVQQCLDNAGFFRTAITNAIDYHASYIELYSADLHAALHPEQYTGDKKSSAESMRQTLLDNKPKLKKTISSSTPPPTDDPPSVSLTAPAENTQVTSGNTITMKATAVDDHGVTKVEFRADGNVVCIDRSTPYTCLWNTSGQTLGVHNLSAWVYDGTHDANPPKSKRVPITINAPVATDAPPTVQLTVPKNGDKFNLAKVSTIKLRANALDDKGIAKVRFYIGETLLDEITVPSDDNYYETYIDTNDLTAGRQYTVYATAHDTANKTTKSGSITFGTLTAWLTAPNEGDIFNRAGTGKYKIEAKIVHYQPISKVDFYIDNKFYSKATNVSGNIYSLMLDPDDFPLGWHNVYASAYDAAGFQFNSEATGFKVVCNRSFLHGYNASRCD